MLFNSTYSENLKRQTIRVKVGCIPLGEDGNSLTYTELLLKAEQLIKRSRVNSEKIVFQHLREEVDEFGHEETILYVYHERMETDAEYRKRIQKLQVKDLQEFYKVLVHTIPPSDKKKKSRNCLTNWEKLNPFRLIG